jgi:acetylornithine deacetylase/succinyl-diaminopimelate desuccinylase-like protein
MDQILNYIDANKDYFINDLVEFLKIPSVSAKPEHKPDMQKAAEVLYNEFKAIGFETRIEETTHHPIVYAEWLKAGSTPTVLFYGHYDVQPAEPFDLWKSPPFEPLIEGDNIYARGACDDKGQLFTHLNCLKTFMNVAGKLPVNVKVVIEGEEEVGGSSLPNFVKANPDLLACDCIVISDSAMISEKKPSLCYALRGILGTELKLTGPNRDLHSGSYGGAVPNPIDLLCRMVAALHDDRGMITISGFYDDVVQMEDWEREEVKKLGFDEDAYRKDLGLNALYGEHGYNSLERSSARPALDCNGIYGGYTGEGGKTIIPSYAVAKISMRLVPNQAPIKIFDNFVKFLNEIKDPSVQLEIDNEPSKSPAVLIRPDQPVFNVARAALKKSFGAEPVLIREGGSIPVVSDFSNILKAPCLMMGFGLPDDEVHAPNEKFNLKNYINGIKTMAYFLDLLKDS